MFAPSLAYALVLASTALVGGGVAMSPAADRSSKRCAIAIPSRPGHERPASLSGSDPSLSSKETALPDDEVEIPDEPEDGDPDDPGDAIDPSGRAAPVPSIPEERTLGLPVPAMSSHVFAHPAVGPERPRFLSLCRFVC
jgi:hypothetical protein